MGVAVKELAEETLLGHDEVLCSCRDSPVILWAQLKARGIVSIP